MSKSSVNTTANKAVASPSLVTSIENAGKIGGALGAFGAITTGVLHVNGVPLDVDLLLKAAAVGAASGGAIGAVQHAGREVIADVKRWVGKAMEGDDMPQPQTRIEPHMTQDRRPAYGIGASYGDKRIEPRVEWRPAVLESNVGAVRVELEQDDIRR